MIFNLCTDATRAILWDMDGVIIDSLRLDLDCCSALASKHIGRPIVIPEALIRKHFALDHMRYWRALFDGIGETVPDNIFASIFDEYESLRVSYRYAVLPGVERILDRAAAEKVACAVVSSNEELLIRSVINSCGLSRAFRALVGFDTAHPHGQGRPLAKKPAPDTYEAALSLLDVRPQEALVIEDSLAGVQAGLSAGCTVLAVATGGTSFESLEAAIPKGRGRAVRSLVE